jgi:DnaK suppressor protein
MPTAKELERFKKNLTKMREKLVDQTEHMEKDVHSGQEGKYSFNHAADAATDTFELDFSMERLESEENLLKQVDDALQRIEKGEYGQCEECSKKITLERLRAIPFASFCLSCQEENENT